jgi:hypothetical protein
MLFAGRVDAEQEMTHDMRRKAMTFPPAVLLAYGAGRDEDPGSLPAVAVPTCRHQVFGLVTTAELRGELMVNLEPHAVSGSASAVGTSKTITG